MLSPTPMPPHHDVRASSSKSSDSTYPAVQTPSGILVACFVVPAEQAETLLSMFRSITHPLPNEAPVNSPPSGTTPSALSVSWLTHAEAAAYLGVAESTLYRYAEQERIESRKIANRLEYRRVALDRFKEQQIRPARRARSHGIIPPTLGSGN